MNIVHVIPGLSIRGGGGNRACAELAESQARLGHKVSIVFLRDEEEETFKPDGCKLICCERNASLLGRYLDVSDHFRNKLTSSLDDADIIHLHALWRYLNVVTRQVSVAHDLPYVLQPHGSVHPWKLNHKKYRKMLWSYFFEKATFTSASAVHAESQSDRDDILRFCPGAKVFVVPCGTYGDRLRTKTRHKTFGELWPECNGKKVILYLARVDVNKGIDNLIKSAATLKAELGKHHFVIAGPDYAGTTHKMQALATDLGVADQFTWAGMVSEEVKRFALQECDYYALPSLSENFGISILEALFCRRPVLTTTETAWKDLREHGAAVIVKPDTESLSAGLRRIVSMSEREKEAMAENGYEYVRGRFEWSAVAAQTVRAYENILARSDA